MGSIGRFGSTQIPRLGNALGRAFDRFNRPGLVPAPVGGGLENLGGHAPNLPGGLGQGLSPSGAAGLGTGGSGLPPYVMQSNTGGISGELGPQQVGGTGNVQFGKVDNQIHHTFRHVDKVGLNREMIQKVIKEDLNSAESSLIDGLNKRSVIVDGVSLDYHVYKLPDGTLNIGRITPPKQ